MIDRSVVRFTYHARVQMERRGISDDEVLGALSGPDEVRSGTHSHELIAIKHFPGGRVRVIYV